MKVRLEKTLIMSCILPAIHIRVRDGDMVIYKGGSRKRVYDMDCYLSKYPLIYLEEGDFLITGGIKGVNQNDTIL